MQTLAATVTGGIAILVIVAFISTSIAKCSDPPTWEYTIEWGDGTKDKPGLAGICRARFTSEGKVEITSAVENTTSGRASVDHGQVEFDNFDKNRLAVIHEAIQAVIAQNDNKRRAEAMPSAVPVVAFFTMHGKIRGVDVPTVAFGKLDVSAHGTPKVIKLLELINQLLPPVSRLRIKQEWTITFTYSSGHPEGGRKWLLAKALIKSDGSANVTFYNGKNERVVLNSNSIELKHMDAIYRSAQEAFQKGSTNGHCEDCPRLSVVELADGLSRRAFFEYGIGKYGISDIPEGLKKLLAEVNALIPQKDKIELVSD
jgi:hypothetical protein